MNLLLKMKIFVELRGCVCVFFKCISYWPEDGRPYVALGKTLSKQSRMSEARAVYEKGCQATQGENSYIWQVCLYLLFLLHTLLHRSFLVVD